MGFRSRLVGFLDARLPWLAAPLRRFRRMQLLSPLRFKSRRMIFSRIYARNAWQGEQSRSGPGSDLKQTENVRRELPGLLRELNVRSLLDAPCGDFFWMSRIDLPVAVYVGADIVPRLIEANNAEHARAGRTFVLADMTKGPLPSCDLILCRDALVHFSNADALAALASFRRSGAIYLLSTTFDVARNEDILTGSHRPINLEIEPFNLGEPLRRIEENAGAELGVPPRSLALWRLRS